MENTPATDADLNIQKQALRCLIQGVFQKIDWNKINVQVLKNLKTYLPNSFKGIRIAGYWPIANEVEIMPFLKEWHLEGGYVCLPAIKKKGHPLNFYNWTPDIKMELGLYQIPTPKEKIDPVVPDVLLVPLIAFDKHGHRLGKGGGYYDRTLQKLRSIKRLHVIGLAGEQQLLPSLPCFSYDQPLDVVITENRVHHFGARAQS